MNSETTPTASVLIIGNEILSGKTQDANLAYLATELASLGIAVIEARVIRDDTATIVAVLNEARVRHTYVFTTGGIGPTHDDITAAAIAKAFGVELELSQEALGRLTASGREVNDARRKMAMVPAGATLIDNSVSAAPGFRLENVFVLAGIPKIARAMFEAAKPELETAAAILSAAITVEGSEGVIAAPLGAIADSNTTVEIGSYPFSRDGRFGTTLVVRGTDRDAIHQAMNAIRESLRGLGLPFTDA
jgi:molybdenum cofactor synthesis domain-containing protein